MTLQEKILKNIKLDDVEILAIYESLNVKDEFYFDALIFCLKQVEFAYENKVLSKNMKFLVEDILVNSVVKDEVNRESVKNYASHVLIKTKSDSFYILNDTFFSYGKDNFSSFLKKFVLTMEGVSVSIFFSAINYFKKVKKNEINATFKRHVMELIDTMGIDNYRDFFVLFSEHIINMDIFVLNYFSIKNSLKEEYIFISKENINIVRSLILSSYFIFDKNISLIIIKLASTFYKKNKYTSLSNSKLLLNTCVFLLSIKESGDCVFALSSIRNFVVDKNIKSKINLVLDNIALHLNINKHDLEDMSIPDFGFSVN